MNADQEQDLITKVAKHLTGETVKVRFRVPVVGELGQVYQASGGVVVLDVNPEVNLNKRWGTLLHELAHIRLKHHLYTTTSHQASPGSGGNRTQKEKEQWKVNPLEKAADSLAQRWREHAERRGNHYYNLDISMTPVQALLYSLLEWKEG